MINCNISYYMVPVWTMGCVKNAQ